MTGRLLTQLNSNMEYQKNRSISIDNSVLDGSTAEYFNEGI